MTLQHKITPFPTLIITNKPSERREFRPHRRNLFKHTPENDQETPYRSKPREEEKGTELNLELSSEFTKHNSLI